MIFTNRTLYFYFHRYSPTKTFISMNIKGITGGNQKIKNKYSLVIFIEKYDMSIL